MKKFLVSYHTLAALLLLTLGADSGETHTGTEDLSREQEYVFQTIRNRRTVRRFRPDSIPESHLLMILDAARYAPTCGNQQPWKFLVIRERSVLDSLASASVEWTIESYREAHDPDTVNLAAVQEYLRRTIEDNLSAPVYVAVLVDTACKYPEYMVHDGCLAVENLMIMARALGYGTGFYTSYFPDQHMRDFLEYPGRYRLICLTPIGVPVQWPETPEKVPLDSLVVLEEF